MESVRWFRGATPGANSSRRNIVPLGNVVPAGRWPASASPVLSTGKPSVVQTFHAVAPGRGAKVFAETSSIWTIARPLASWPVTTRRTCNAMLCSPFALGCSPYGEAHVFTRCGMNISCIDLAAERYASGAGNSWSDAGAEAIASRLHALVRPGPTIELRWGRVGESEPGCSTVTKPVQ